MSDNTKSLLGFFSVVIAGFIVAGIVYHDGYQAGRAIEIQNCLETIGAGGDAEEESDLFN